MSPDREDNVDDGANDITYPSPTAEPMDAGPFYHTGPRDGGAQEHVEPVEHHEVHDIHDPDQVKGHEHEHEHEQNDISAMEPPTSQHVSRPTNLEELQLAAQLGQGLAGTPLIPNTDPNMNVEDPNLRSIMPAHENDQHHSPYIHDAQNSEQLLQHGLPEGLPVSVGPALAQHYSLDNGIPPRKRSKVSRACDECRRKKIKCDAQSDTGETPCSSCARSNIRCLFSRIPQKRGPSKGYIKELADRIHSIEHKLESEGSLSHEDLDGLFAADRNRQSNVGGEPRKRPFSSISTGDLNTPVTTRQTPWGSEPRPIQPASALENHSAAPYVNATLAPMPSALKTDSTPSKVLEGTGDATGDVTGDVTVDVSMAELNELNQLSELEEGVLQDYLATVQTVYPILPSSHERVQTLLGSCPASVRMAFVHALLAVAQSSSGDVRLASALLNEWESDDSPRSQPVNIVHAQALLLLIIDADWRGSPTLPSLLARAVALANTMKLWRYTTIPAAADPDSDDSLCIRIWWSLVLMERWHATGTGKPVQIPDSSAVAPPGLEALVGDVCFHLIRLSKLLSKLSHVISALPTGASTTEPTIAAILSDYIENYREDLPVTIEPATHPLVHLAYWHCRLVVVLLTPGATPAEIMWPTKELIELLSINADIRTPLAKHFSFLVALSLAKLCRLEASSDEAVQLAREILDKPGGVWDSIRDKLSERARPTSSAEAIASHGLQHLADLATAHQGEAAVAGEGEAGEGPGAGDDDVAGSSLAQGYLEVV